MIINKKIGNISSFDINGRAIDHVPLEWYETNKRILHKKTRSGMEVVMKFLNENQQLTQDDIIYADEETIIAIDIIDCDALVIRPKSMLEMATICYEIGNKHLPLFYQEGELLVAHDAPLLKLLQAGGYEISTGKRKLIQPLKTTVTPHGNYSESLFSKIVKLTTKP